MKDLNKLLIILKKKSTQDFSEYKKFLDKMEAKGINGLFIEDFDDEITINDLDGIRVQNNIETFNNYILVTDSLTLGICTYRLFHYDFLDFLVFFNPLVIESLRNYPESQIEFVKALINLNGLENETIPKKLFINLNEYNFKDICKSEKLINQISIIDDFEVKNGSEMGNINKLYHLSELENFYIDNNGEKTEEICLYQENEQFGAVYYLYNRNQIIIISYFLLNSLHNNNITRFNNQLEKLFYENKDKQVKQEFLEVFFGLLNKTFRDNKLKISIANVFLFYECNHDYILEQILNELEKNTFDKIYLKSIYNYLIAGYLRREFIFSDKIYVSLREIHNEYVDFVTKKIGNKNLKKMKSDEKNKESSKIVILIDQLLTKFHAPTAVLITTLSKLLDKTDSEFLLVVEENLIVTEGEYFGSLNCFGNSSITLAEMHRNLFDTKRVNITYANFNKSMVKRSEDLLKTIINFNPEAIISFSSHSIIQNLLYPRYPVVNISFGMELLVNKAHVYLYKNAGRAKELEEKICPNLNDNIFEFTYDGELLERTKNYSRSDFKYTDEDFIIITSGNRIESEIDRDLIDCMNDLMLHNSSIKWLLVGSKIPKYLLETYSEQLLNQIKHIPFEEDLIALNKICDVSINPNRIGGGYSVTSCISAGIPVIMCEFESDGLTFVGRENTFGEDYRNVIEEVVKCFKDPNYKKMLHQNQFEYNKRFFEKDNTQELLKYIEYAKKIKTKGV